MQNLNDKYWQLTEFLQNLNIDLWPWGQGLGKICIMAMLIYRHWAIMAYCEVVRYNTFREMWSLLHKQANIPFALA